jgi:hypothetical protein
MKPHSIDRRDLLRHAGGGVAGLAVGLGMPRAFAATGKRTELTPDQVLALLKKGNEPSGRWGAIISGARPSRDRKLLPAACGSSSHRWSRTGSGRGRRAWQEVEGVDPEFQVIAFLLVEVDEVAPAFLQDPALLWRHHRELADRPHDIPLGVYFAGFVAQPGATGIEHRSPGLLDIRLAGHHGPRWHQDAVLGVQGESIKFRGVLRLLRQQRRSGCHLRSWPDTIC